MTITLDGTLGVTFPAGGAGNPAGAVVGTTDTQTLTNKTLTAPTVTGTLAAAVGTFSSTLAVTGITTVAAGSAALPSIISTTGTADTGQFFPAADTVAFSTAGTERVRIGSTGLVGIGTTTPAQMLEIKATNQTGFVGAAIQNNNGNIGIAGTQFSSDATYYKAAIGLLRASPNGVGSIVFYNDSNTDAADWATTDEKMRITSAGNVGIGNTSPTQKLQVDGAIIIGNFGSNQYLYFDGSTNYVGRNSTTGDIHLAAAGGTNIVFTVAAAEKMRINSSGNVGVGTTSPSGKIAATSTSTTVSPFYAESPASFATANYISTSVTAASTGWYHFYSTSSSATIQNCIIFGNGNIQNTNNSYGALSDIKLKENIIDATPKLEQLNRVRVVNFNLKLSPEQKQLGVIAQELEDIFPGMVDEINDRDADGNVLETKTKSVKYSVFVPMLIKAMQEQQAIIETLTARITALETE